MIRDKKLGINFYIPITKINENFDIAVKKDACIKEKFYVRKYFSRALHGDDCEKDDIVYITMEDFLLGNQEFDGMKVLIEEFISLNNETFEKEEQIDSHITCKIWKVFEFMVARCKGEILSSASYIR